MPLGDEDERIAELLLRRDDDPEIVGDLGAGTVGDGRRLQSGFGHRRASSATIRRRRASSCRPARTVGVVARPGCPAGAAGRIETAAYLKWGCLLTRSHPVIVRRLAVVG